MVLAVVDQLERVVDGLGRVSRAGAENGGELALIAVHRFACFPKFALVLGAGEFPLDAVVHHRRVRQRNAHVGALDEPHRTALRLQDDEGEVHVVERPQHEHAVVGSAAVVDASTLAGEEHDDLGTGVELGEVLQNRYFALTSGHSGVPDEDVLAVDLFDHRFEVGLVAGLQLNCLVGGVVLHGDLLSFKILKNEPKCTSVLRKTPVGAAEVTSS